MNTDGKKFDVLIEPVIKEDLKTGISIESEYSFIVWADFGLREFITQIKGVATVWNSYVPNKYEVSIDHRYDLEFVKREVEAKILCREE